MKTPSSWIVSLLILPLLGSGVASAQRVTGRSTPQAPSAAPAYRPAPSVRPSPAPSYRPAPTARPMPTYRPAPTPTYRPTPTPTYRPTPPRQVVPQRVTPQTRPMVRPTVKPVPQVQPKPKPQSQVTPKPTPPRGPNAVPATRPTFKPAIRPDSTVAPSVPRPRPSIRPMPEVTKKVTPPDSTAFNRTPARPMVSPRQPTQTSPSIVKRPVGFARPDGKPGRPTLTRPISQGGVLTRPAQLDPVTQRKWGNWGKWSNATQSGLVNAAVINRNYRCAVNWSYRPNCWGANPWWASTACHRSWYCGHWNYGWSPYWYNHCYSNWYPCTYPGYYVRSYPISWGLACWSLGSLVYDTGYYVYRNPYRPEPYHYESTVIDYEQPMSVISREYTSGDEIASDLSASRSADALERSRDSFRDEDFLTALSAVDEAISYQPGDSALHEYRALVLFALGKYKDAAGVLHPLLASGPGWDRETMVGLYRSEDRYLTQLAKLEQYVAARPDQPAPRFLLGYHYLVGGDLDRAAKEFDEVSSLRSDDTISRQLRELARASVKSDDADSGESTPPAPGDAGPEVEGPSATQLVGTWRSDRAENGVVTLSLRGDAGFTWTFKRDAASPTELTGTWEINDRGLLVLSSENAQMVGEVKFSTSQKMSFILAGGPEGDPGLSFDRTP
ncbi:tetratricopeptide repeat protein [Luteolibacter soli]|uniref:Tetratricopeptide repeat protein n=1 Tax=Luteolibacter soli TaxID=3135280 RepID=A0ABU9AYK1_9BACT